MKIKLIIKKIIINKRPEKWGSGLWTKKHIIYLLFEIFPIWHEYHYMLTKDNKK